MCHITVLYGCLIDHITCFGRLFICLSRQGLNFKTRIHIELHNWSECFVIKPIFCSKGQRLLHVRNLEVNDAYVL